MFVKYESFIGFIVNIFRVYRVTNYFAIDNSLKFWYLFIFYLIKFLAFWYCWPNNNSVYYYKLFNRSIYLDSKSKAFGNFAKVIIVFLQLVCLTIWPEGPKCKQIITSPGCITISQIYWSTARYTALSASSGDYRNKIPLQKPIAVIYLVRSSSGQKTELPTCCQR